MDKDDLVSIFYDYKFSREELEEIARKFAGKWKEKIDTEDEKKSVMSQYKAKLDEMEAAISSLTAKHRDKKEIRQIDAELRLNHDTKQREYYNPDTGELLKKEGFRNGDCQRKLL
jgi:type I site-specific restriction-modification system R (restriction) subunit